MRLQVRGGGVQPSQGGGTRSTEPEKVWQGRAHGPCMCMQYYADGPTALFLTRSLILSHIPPRRDVGVDDSDAMLGVCLDVCG